MSANGDRKILAGTAPADDQRRMVAPRVANLGRGQSKEMAHMDPFQDTEPASCRSKGGGTARGQGGHEQLGDSLAMSRFML